MLIFLHPSSTLWMSLIHQKHTHITLKIKGRKRNTYRPHLENSPRVLVKTALLTITFDKVPLCNTYCHKGPFQKVTEWLKLSAILRLFPILLSLV